MKGGEGSPSWPYVEKTLIRISTVYRCILKRMHKGTPFFTQNDVDAGF